MQQFAIFKTMLKPDFIYFMQLLLFTVVTLLFPYVSVVKCTVKNKTKINLTDIFLVALLYCSMYVMLKEGCVITCNDIYLEISSC